MDDNKLNRKVNILIVIGIIVAIAIVALLVRSFTFTPNIKPVVSRLEATVDGPDLIIELVLDNYDPSLGYTMIFSEDVDTTVAKELTCNEGKCHVDFDQMPHVNVRAEYDIFMKTCDMSGLRDDYNKALVNLNREVLVLDPRGQYKGKALGIDNEGSLLVRREDGNISAVISGEVSVRGIYGYV